MIIKMIRVIFLCDTLPCVLDMIYQIGHIHIYDNNILTGILYC